jgi:ferredoxin
LTVQIRVDPVACTAHGLCAEWLPERIELDEWGYPIVDTAPLTPDLIRHARRAARECPVRALRLPRE